MPRSRVGLRALYESGVAPGNNVKAYAAYYAYATLGEQAMIYFGSGRSEARKTAQRWLENELEKIGSSLTPSQVEQAIAEALVLIRSNANCCYTN